MSNVVPWKKTDPSTYDETGSIPEQIKARERAKREATRQREGVADFLSGFKFGAAISGLIASALAIFLVFGPDGLTAQITSDSLIAWLGGFLIVLAILAHLTHRGIDRTLPRAP